MNRIESEIVRIWLQYSSVIEISIMARAGPESKPTQPGPPEAEIRSKWFLNGQQHLKCRQK